MRDFTAVFLEVCRICGCITIFQKTSYIIFFPFNRQFISLICLQLPNDLGYINYEKGN